jgi:predicted lipid-binding transport protein (Tim44 family)
MRKLLSVFIALVGLSFIAVEADARRMSGGKSIGKQREAINPNQAAPRTPPQQQQQATPNTPAQQQAAPGAGAAAAQPSGMSRWLGPLAGLAIGAGLASLFLNNGLAGALGGILLAAALAFGIFFLFRLLTRGRAQPAPLRYAGAGPQVAREMPREPVEPVLGRTSAPAPHSVAAATATTAATPATRWPGFDEAQFVRHARMNFVDLQSAYDRNDMAAIRDFVTPELAAEIEKDMRAAETAEKTDVVTLEAEVLDVATENGLYIVSVRFSGLMREGAAEPQPFTELWHLEKPVDGRSGWVISGIQQA